MVFSSIEKDFDLAPFDMMSVKGKTRLLHFHHNNGAKGKDEEKRQTLLIICAPINRFHITDISQDRSVVKGLLSKGLYVYMLDWGYPTWEDSSLSLTDYVNYVKDVVQNIKDKTGTAKVSILGYCWGGIIALVYAALNNENLRSLTLMAAPVDFSKDNTILANWSRVIDSDKIVDEFGQLDGILADIFSTSFPPQIMIRTDGVAELMKNTIFYSKAATSSSNDLLLLTGDSQPISPESEYLLAEQILYIATKFNTKKVFTLAASVSGVFVDTPRVFGTATDSDIVKTFPEKIS
jgi:hypothetical protein